MIESSLFYAFHLIQLEPDLFLHLKLAIEIVFRNCSDNRWNLEKHLIY